MRIHICGARGSTPAPGPAFVRYGGHTSCLALAHDGEPPSLLLDAGTGLRRVWELLDGHPFDGSVLLGHLHWDHTHGLPFFRAGDHAGARVDVHLPAQPLPGRDGPADPEAVLAVGMQPPNFPIRPADLRGAWRFHAIEEGTHELEGFTVLAREIPHKGGRTFGYRVSDASGTLAYLSDHHPSALGPGPEGFGPYHDAATELADGVDLLVHDAQYTTEEFAERASFGHSAAPYAVGLAAACRVRRLLLFHHDPARTDDELDELVATLPTRGVDVLAAVEGAALTVPAEPRGP